MDTSTSLTSSDKFVRICVELNLRKNLVSKVILNGESYSIEYKGLKIICFTWGKYDHHKEACLKVIKENAASLAVMEETKEVEDSNPRMKIKMIEMTIIKQISKKKENYGG